MQSSAVWKPSVDLRLVSKVSFKSFSLSFIGNLSPCHQALILKKAVVLSQLQSSLNLFFLHHTSSKHVEIRTEHGDRVILATAYAPFFRYVSIHEGDFKSLFDEAQNRIIEKGDMQLADGVIEALALLSTRGVKTFEEVESLTYTCVDRLRDLHSCILNPSR